MSKLQELIQKLCPNGVEYKKLGEVAKVISGSSAPQKSSDFSDYGIPFCRTSDVGKVHMSVDFSEISDRITETAAKKMHLMPKGTILIPKSGASTLLNHKVRLSIESYVVSHLAAIISNTDVINDRYLYYVLSRFDMIELVDDKNYPSVKTSEIAERIQIPVPPLEVQEEIVRILDNFTNLAAELQAELQARQEQYEYYRDKLLSFNNYRWVEYKRLGDKQVSIMQRGTSLTKNNSTEGAYPVISGGRVPAFYCDKFNREGETITVAGSGAGAGYVQYWNEPIFVCDAFSIKGCEDVSTKYLYYYLTNLQDKIYATKKGGGVPHVHISSIENFLIPIPHPDIQEHIVSILDKFEALVNDLSRGLPAEIAAVQEQYEYYRNKLLSFPRTKVSA